VTSSRIIELDIVNGDQNNAKSGICVVRAAAKKKRGKNSQWTQDQLSLCCSKFIAVLSLFLTNTYYLFNIPS